MSTQDEHPRDCQSSYLSRLRRHLRETPNIPKPTEGLKYVKSTHSFSFMGIVRQGVSGDDRIN